MDSPFLILIDVLRSQGKTQDEVTAYSAGLEDPEDQLDMAEWLLNNSQATRQEILTEKHRLMRNRMKAQRQE